MDTLNNLLRAIIEHPDEDTPRLLYADALDELPSVSRECDQCQTGYISDRAIAMEPSHQRIAGRRDPWNRRWACKFCDGTRFVPDLTNAERAAFIRSAFTTTWIHPEHTTRRWQKWFPDLHDVSYVYNMSQYRGDGLVGTLDRGFLANLRGPAAAFFASADALLWHRDQTVPAPRCDVCGGADVDERGRWKDKHGHDYWIRCRACKGVDRVPRPVPATAQPIRLVTLTTVPLSSGRSDNAPLPLSWFAQKWPDVEFVLEG